MSDFDREAEREKLREKYERDERKREHSERMSELLLKGATMTNVHCEECGDPIFRYDGQEFCPTCQREVGAGSGPEASAGDASGTADSGTAEPTEPAPGDERPDAGDVGDDADRDRADASRGGADASREPAAPSDAAGGDGLAGTGRDVEPPATPEPPAETDQPAGGEPVSGAEGPAGSERGGNRPAAGPSSPPETNAGSASGGGDLDEARAALVRTLIDAARRAEATSDPRTRRDHLAAAREAAETLSALR